MRSDLDHGNLELFEVRPRLLAPHVAEAETRRARISNVGWSMQA